MKCQIQWIVPSIGDIPTPDTNDAIGLAQCTFDYPDGRRTVDAYPICAEHAQRMPTVACVCPLYTSRWTLLPLPTEVK